MQNPLEDFLAKLVPTVAISSKSSNSNSVEVEEMSVTIDGIKRSLINDTVVLTTNGISGDTTVAASACVQIPMDGVSDGKILVKGNASVISESKVRTLAIAGGKEKLRSESQSGLFVVSRIAFQRDSQQEYFDFIFGTSGQSEEVDEKGQKQRPHIAVLPNGNGKYLRLSGHDCEIESTLVYKVSSQRIAANELRIRSLVHCKTILVTFLNTEASEVVSESVSFVE